MNGIGRTGDVSVADVCRFRAGFAALLPSAAVSKVCSVCAKGPGFGNSRSHSMVATKRRFNPNLQRVRILVGGSARRAYVCTRCLKAGKVEKAV
jgi:large subunit ribosomal protein L28